MLCILRQKDLQIDWLSETKVFLCKKVDSVFIKRVLNKY